MTQHDMHSSLAVFDYSNKKLCDLYDSQNDLVGQAFDIDRSVNVQDGVKNLSFSIPYSVNGKRNFRWKYLKSEYLIRLIYNGKTEWYIAQQPSKRKDKNSVYGEVSCSGTEAALKTQNIYKEFYDENGIGTIGELVDKILAGTGWHRGYTDPMLEKDGQTEKIRSLSSGNKKGALGLMSTVCNLFKCFPVYNSDNKTVDLYNFNNRDQVLEGTIGRDMDAVTVKYNSNDIITRLYVEGEYGEDGYVGIDSANPTGLSYIMNFDYFRELGMFTQTHETALAAYQTAMAAKKTEVSNNTNQIIAKEDAINALIGQCKLVVYYTSEGFSLPMYVFGELTSEQKSLNTNDEVIILKNNATYRKATITTSPASMIQSGEYAIAKFVTKASGTVGAMEVQIEAKEKEIANLQRKINNTSSEEKKAAYNTEVTRLNGEIQEIYTKTDGLYTKMHSIMKDSNGLLYQLKQLQNIADTLSLQQDAIESDFIIAMGDMLRDGYWSNDNYIEGQEQALYDDAVERLEILSRPSVTYSFNLIRLHKDRGIPLEQFKLNSIFRIYDEELDIDENLFVTKITIGIDNEDSGSIDVSNNDITLNSNDLGALLSRMSQLSDLIEQKNTLYDRAKAIAKNGTFYADRLNGQIDVLKNQLLSTVSNWHTDDQGNIIFESADGGSSMMLCGAGFMISNSKDDNGDWIWRTFGTGEGFTADEIVAGFISAERIEAGTISTEKVEPGFGGSLVITGNPSITALNDTIAPAFVEGQAYTTGQHINHNGLFYVFVTDFNGGTFAEAEQHLSNTNVATEIELLPDRIVQYVGSRGYGRTFVQQTDPTLDPANNVATGDYWIVTTDAKTWGNLQQTKWQNVKMSIYDALASGHTVYYWNGTKWVRIYDTAVVTEAYTRITQTKDLIQQEAIRADDTYIAKTEQLQTASAIVSKAEQYVDNKLTDYSTTEQTASQITATVSTALGNYSTTTQTASMIQTKITDSLSNYYTKTETASQITATISSKLGDYSTTTQTQSMINSTISSKLGNYSTTTQTQSMINSTVSSKLGSYSTTTQTQSMINSTVSSKLGSYSTTTQTQSMINLAVGSKQEAVTGITINSSGITISGSKYLKLKSGNSLVIESGGTIDVNSNNFVLNSASNIMRAGRWTLSNEGISGKMTSGLYIRIGEEKQCLCISSAITYEQGWTGGGSARFYLKPMKSPVHETGSLGESCISFGEEIVVSGAAGMIGEPNCRVMELWVRHLAFDEPHRQSSRKIKKDIADMPFMGDALDALHPVVYRYKWNPDDYHLSYGLIYEEAKDVLPDICTCGRDNIGSINYEDLICMLLQQVQDLRKRVAALEAGQCLQN